MRIAYISLGDGFPLVFASNIFGEANGYRIGWPQTREITDRLVGLGWRVVRYDVRGMGLSERDVLDLSLEGRVRDLTAVVGHLGLDRFALGGLDVGAATAVAYAVQHPASVSHLILLSPWASGAHYLYQNRYVGSLIHAATRNASVNPTNGMSAIINAATTHRIRRRLPGSRRRA